MNHKLLTLSISSLTILSLAAIYQPPVLAQRTSFYCDTTKSPPTTYIKSRGRRSAVIRWNLGIGRSSALQRCKIVSQRFQRQYDSGNLRFFKTGFLNGYPVVCAARTSGDRCTNRMLLFTLTRGSNPNTVLAQLFNLNSLASSAVINQSGVPPVSPVIAPQSSRDRSQGGENNTREADFANEKTYSFDNYLNNLPNEEDPSDEPTLEGN
ncbi:COP23 domain-containing protein [Merismopedia glauca]|uniref:Uncharacterized protein n=1 Tax=Merismopedia glauca CCAP 1448/3 TaxID=1296344 RepID=A0A2T1C877_9CYAN|nr:COP23 domain-containing protein [Merismopedia glauca]PSB04347.1 hypothetical protein C7B64_04580 [Merismopedia glauca CCAP 1448/3]